MKIIDNGPGNPNNQFQEATDYDGYIGIEIRGQSSQMFPKKSYSIELRTSEGDETSAALLGMPKEEDWVLYAPLLGQDDASKCPYILPGQQDGRLAAQEPLL